MAPYNETNKLTLMYVQSPKYAKLTKTQMDIIVIYVAILGVQWVQLE